MSEPLPETQIERALADMPGWSHAEGALRKRYTFSGFAEAMGFMVRVGFAAERQNHHPQLTNVYHRVDVSLSTHDAGDVVTANDLELARAIEAIHRPASS